jgi:hypothetical protein
MTKAQKVLGFAVAIGWCGACYVVAPPPPPNGPPPAPYAGGPGCDLGSRPWQQTSPGACPASTWRFMRRADGAWQANETGCAGATGVASYDGNVVTLDFQYAGGAGRYSWPLDVQCRSAPGQVSWSAGPLNGQSVPSTLAPAPF